MWIAIGAALFAALVLAGIYNYLVGKKNQVENAFGGLDAMLKKRYDLIPNLISTLNRYMKHEAYLLSAVTELRTKAYSDNLNNDDKIALDSRISKNISGIMVAVENYPDLKANQNFIHLQRSLNEVEEQISAARRTYNASVTDYNNSIEMFPSNVFAQMMRYKRKPVLENPEIERENVDVKKLFSP
jgi:LemA protein